MKKTIAFLLALMMAFPSVAYSSIYTVEDSIGIFEDDSTVIDVAYHFFNRKGVRLHETEVIEYELKIGEDSLETSYEIPEIEGKNASLRDDSAPEFTLSGGVITAVLDGSAAVYDVNVEYASSPAEYTVNYLFQTMDGSSYEEDTVNFPSETVESEVNDLTDVKPEVVTGFFAQPVSQQMVNADGSATVEVKYDRKSIRISYDTAGGTFIPSARGLYGAEAQVYAAETEEDVLTCKIEPEHTHDSKPGNKPALGTTSQPQGCWTFKGSGMNRSWVLTCSEEEHTHGDGCYSDITAYDPAPVKPGYAFSGWYLDKECTTPAPESVIFTEDKVVYAKWVPATTEYSIVAMKENTDGSYSYLATVIQKAKVGSTIQLFSDPKIEFIDSDYYHFNNDKSTGAVVKADGSTVIYAYYDLNTYKLDFSLYPNGNSTTTQPADDTYLEMDGEQYYKDDTHYTIECRYGDDISAQWPTSGDVHNASLHGWNCGIDGTKALASKRPQLSSDMILDTADGATTYYYADLKERKFPVELHYWLQNADDDGYTDSPVYRQSATTDNGWTQKEIIGFTKDPSRNKETTNVEYNYYYSRNTYSIEYFNGAYNTNTISGIRFEKDISSDTYNYEPDAPVGKENYTFGGWYDNPGCAGDPFFFNKMPAGNLALYAEWIPPLLELTVDLNYDGLKEIYDVQLGSVPLDFITVPVREGYEFTGWYTEAEGNEPFDTSAPLFADTTVFAHYEQIRNTEYTVEYLTESGNPVAQSKIFDSLVGNVERAEAIALSGDYADYVVDEDVKFITPGYDTDENIVSFIYADPEELHYMVRYEYEGSTDTDPKIAKETDWELAGSKSKIVKADLSILEDNPGYTLDATAKWLKVSSDETKNVVTFILSPREYVITYNNVDALWAETQQKTYTAEDEVTLSKPQASDGYSFIGWDFTTDEGVVVTSDHSHYDTVMSPGSYGDHEFTALWAKITAMDKTAYYDGSSHAVDPAALTPGPGTDASVLDGYTVTYSMEENGTYTETVPEKTEIGEYVVYIKAEKDDYGTLKTTCVLKILEMPATPDEPTPQEPTYSVEYVVTEDPEYGIPDGSQVPVDPTAYKYDDPVTVIGDLSTTDKDAVSNITNETVSGEWKFTSWDRTDFRITDNTTITGKWTFVPQEPVPDDPEPDDPEPDEPTPDEPVPDESEPEELGTGMAAPGVSENVETELISDDPTPLSEAPETAVTELDQDESDDEPLDEFQDEEVPLAMLPQTGMLWWPAAILLALGVVLTIIGFVSRKKDA